MRLTMEQRVQALEREITVLQDTVKVLHKLLKNQSTLINDYILQTVSKAMERHGDENGRPEDAVYAFVCRKRFDKIERDIKVILRAIENLGIASKAG